MSDHFDHYKRPPSRDNSVDRYSRAASRLSGGSRQSSVEKSQNQQQQRRGGDDRFPSSFSSAADKSVNGAAGFTAPSMSGAMQNVPSSSAMQRQPPFEEVILRQRNLGQEIVPSPIGQPKRTESLYVNPNTARKDTKPKVSTTSTRITSSRDSIKNDDDYNSYYGSVGSGGSNYNYGNRHDDSDIDCPFYDCRSSMRDSSASVDYDYAYAYGYDWETRGTNDFHTNASTSYASRSINDIDDSWTSMGIVQSIPIRGDNNGQNIRTSGNPYAFSRYSDDDRPRSSSSNPCIDGFLCFNPLAREIGIGGSKCDCSNAYLNGIFGENPALNEIGVGQSRSGSSNVNLNRFFGDNHARRERFRRLLPNIKSPEPLARSNSGDYHDRANAEGYASGNSRGVIPSGGSSIMPPSGDSSLMPPSGDSSLMPPSGDSSLMPPSGDSSLMPPRRYIKSNIPSKDSKGRRRRKDLRVRFSDEVNNGDDHDSIGSDLDRGNNRIRSVRLNSHLNSDNSNRVRTNGSVDRESRNTGNIQIGSHGDCGNSSNYGRGNGSTRGNIGNYSNIAEIQSRFDGYRNGGICSRSEVREVDMMHSRSSIVDIDEGHVINNIYNDGGIVVNSGNDARSVIRNNKREHDSIAVNSNSGIDYIDYTDEYAYNGEHDWIHLVGECDLESGYDYGDNENESNGSSEEGAVGGERIPRLLPSQSPTNEMVWFETSLKYNEQTVVLFKIRIEI
ncbi:putative serine/threonine-protein kinase clkA [Aphis craccivora]|uniref:Putative serine/threonine-protein kinase clkA n=1 Tax=Aphis craccivora TaxID=307492 RepID=A0A6G0Z6J0_APHCR|nr:putative serine/threonine-protein kinase clkA [Aphis craccivora]